MHKKYKGLICFVAAAVIIGTCAGCSNTQTMTSSSVSASALPTGKEMAAKGMAGDIEYEISDNVRSSGKWKRGYYIDKTDKPDSPYYIIICSGEKPSDGYGIRIIDIGLEDNDCLTVMVEETAPSAKEVAAVMTYPACALTVKRFPAELKVVSTAGETFVRGDNGKEAETEIVDGYCAVLHNGAGEIMQVTYVYKTDSGFRYINATSTTVSYGSTKWKDTVKSSGTAATKEEVVDAARQFGSCGFATYPGDMNPYSIDEFLKRDL